MSKPQVSPIKENLKKKEWDIEKRKEEREEKRIHHLRKMNDQMQI